MNIARRKVTIKRNRSQSSKLGGRVDQRRVVPVSSFFSFVDYFFLKSVSVRTLEFHRFVPRLVGDFIFTNLG